MKKRFIEKKDFDMKYEEYGRDQKECVILLHGGGLAPWNYHGEAELLQQKYHVIVPVLDGHGGSDSDFVSIEENAKEIIHYIDTEHGGHVFMIGGLSLGGQILVEILSQRSDICEYALIESALILPMKTTAAWIKPSFSFFYPLVKKRWFSKLQFNTLHINKKYFEDYYRDTVAISKENMISFLIANADYKRKDSLHASRAKVLVVVGSKESAIMKKSARMIHEIIPQSFLEVLPGYYHGDLSVNHPDEYIKMMKFLINATNFNKKC